MPNTPDLDELVRVLMDDAATGLLVLDPQARIERVNAAALRLMGLSAARSRNADAVALLRTAVAGDDLVDEAFRRARTEREAVLHPPGGAEAPVRLRTFRYGKPPRVLVVLEDVSQLRRIHQELRRHERLATLGQLSAGVAHEIRNPLAGIGTSAQVLLRRFEPGDDRARFVQVILDEVKRLDRIVTSLLEYARPRTPELKPTPLGECVRKAVEASRSALGEARVSVEIDVAPRLAAVWLDPDLVHQVLLNVALNAVQAMPQGGTLRFEVRRVRRRPPPRGTGRRAEDQPRGSRGGSGWIELQQVRIIDTGVGMPRGVLEKLFDPFFTTKATGTGLGLSIVQTIMQEHGGSIAVDSRQGRGTTVFLNFPVEKRHGQRRQLDARTGGTHAAHRG